MHDITIHFLGGINIILEDCNENCVNSLSKWLDDKDQNETFKINIPDINRTKCIRKELILFVDID